MHTTGKSTRNKALATLILLSGGAASICRSDPAGAAQKPGADAPAIKPIKVKGFRVRPNAGRFTGKPQTVTGGKGLAKVVSDKRVCKQIEEQMDFSKQYLLVFKWAGSGQDRISYDVAESCPEQIQFQYKPGRTRDLRGHVHLFALRKGVTWKVAGRRSR